MLDRITINPDICNGKPTIRNMRITAQSICEFLGKGDKIEDILNQFPMLEKEDIFACFEYAGQILSNNFYVKEYAN